MVRALCCCWHQIQSTSHIAMANNTTSSSSHPNLRQATRFLPVGLLISNELWMEGKQKNEYYHGSIKVAPRIDHNLTFSSDDFRCVSRRELC